MSISKLMTGMTAAAIFGLAGMANAYPDVFQSNGTGGGDWKDATSWLVYDDGSFPPWVAAVQAPASGDTVEILASDAITVTGVDAAAAQVTVDASGALTISNGRSLTLDSSGSATINGAMTVTGSFVAPASGSVSISGSVDIAGNYRGYGTNTNSGTVVIENGGVLYVYGTFNANATETIVSGGVIDVNGGTLSVSNSSISLPAASLILEGTSPVLTLNLADAIDLPNASSSVWVATSATFNGSGSMVGQNAAASIKVGPSSGTATVQLSNDAVIRGSLIIKKNNVSFGTAIFSNDTAGYVIADGNYTGTGLFLDSSLDTLTARTNDSSGSTNAQFQSIGGIKLQFDKAPSAGRYLYVHGSSVLTVNVAFAGSGINTGHGTVNGSQSTFFLANTPTY